MDPYHENNKSSAVITKESIQTKINAINARQGVDETIKTKVLSYYKSALDNLALEEQFNANSEQFKQALKQASEQAKELQTEIEQIQQKQNNQNHEDFSKIPDEELTQRSIIENQKIDNLNEQIKKLEDQLDAQQGRPQFIRNETLKINHELEVSKKEMEMLGTSQASYAETNANLYYLKTLIDANSAEINMLVNEAASNPTRIVILKLELQLLQARKIALTPIAKIIENYLAEKKQQQVKNMQDDLSQAENQLMGKCVVIQEVTRENIQYTQELHEVNTKIDLYSGLKLTTEQQTNTIESDFKSAYRKIKLAGLSPPLGRILREQRRELTNEIKFRQQSENVESETAKTNLNQLTTDDQIKKTSDINNYLNQIMTGVDTQLPLEKRMMIQAELRVLLNDQKALLNNLSIAYNDYLRTLDEYDFAYQQMRGKAQEYAKYLDENLLWVKNADAINSQFIINSVTSLRELFSQQNWIILINNTLNFPYINPFLSLFAILNLLLLLFYRKSIKHQLVHVAEKINTHSEEFHHTVKALLCKLILVLPLPLFIYYWGWFLNSDATIDNFSRSVGTGMLKAAVSLFFLQFIYHLLEEDGVMRIHFHWQNKTTKLLRTQITWLRFAAVPCVFLMYYTETTGNFFYSENLGRFALIISLISISVFWFRVLKPEYGLLHHFISRNPDGWLSKISFILILSVTSTPLVIAGFAVTGYYSSALELQLRSIDSFRLVFIVIIIHELMFRWLYLAKRQLAIKNKELKTKNLALSEKTSNEYGSEEPILLLDEQIDISKINAQTISVLNVFIFFALTIGFWLIWKHILPAFSFIENIVLWHYKVTENKQEIEQTITLFNLFLAGLYVFVTFVSVSNFSGVMEMLLFSKSSIEAGSRYAIIQLSTYLLIIAGFFAVANELGGSWGELQWLVAALGVGLGFGLQEIFGNFVSGIILLFERPIRIGDTITIGGVNGKVCHIQMRATTLIDNDQKEVIVPNKTFITSQLVNWTLSDAVTRVIFTIGIAYGSDLEMAHKLILETVIATPLVLNEPAPSVLLNDFGDSSINFTIRIFVAELKSRLLVTHDLHLRLEKALREHNIEIPFPQRDIHVRSTIPELVTK